jgi:hypothetical protein
MRKRFRHPQLGEFHKLDLKGSFVGGTTMVSDAQLMGLAKFLNEGGAQEERKRIIGILEDMQLLERLEEPIWGETKAESDSLGSAPFMVVRKGRAVLNPVLRRIAPIKYEQQLEIEERKHAINQGLAMNAFHPYVWPSKHRKWMVMWQIQRRPATKDRIYRGVLEMDDCMALQMVLDLARAGYLDRLRRCTCCTMWLYAKFKHQNFCSTKCQQKHYAQSPDWKAKRRDYMRAYRQAAV